MDEKSGQDKYPNDKKNSEEKTEKAVNTQTSEVPSASGSTSFQDFHTSLKSISKRLKTKHQHQLDVRQSETTKSREGCSEKYTETDIGLANILLELATSGNVTEQRETARSDHPKEDIQTSTFTDTDISKGFENVLKSRKTLTYGNKEYKLSCQFPGISIFKYLNSQEEGVVEEPIIILPKPFSSVEQEDIEQKFAIRGLRSISVVCGLCNRQFDSADQIFKKFWLKEKLPRRTKKNRYRSKCMVCDRNYELDHVIEYHLLSHISDKEVFCSDCDIKDEISEELEETPVKSVIAKSNLSPRWTETVIFCQKCKLALCLGEKFIMKLLKNKRADKKTKNYEYICSVCGEVYRWVKQKTETHILTHNKIFCSECFTDNRVREDTDILPSLLPLAGAQTTTMDESSSSSVGRTLKCKGECERAFFFGNWRDAVEIKEYNEEGRIKRAIMCLMCEKSYKRANFRQMELHVLEHFKTKDMICAACRSRKQDKNNQM